MNHRHTDGAKKDDPTRCRQCSVKGLKTHHGYIHFSGGHHLGSVTSGFALPNRRAVFHVWTKPLQGSALGHQRKDVSLFLTLFARDAKGRAVEDTTYRRKTRTRLLAVSISEAMQHTLFTASSDAKNRA